MIPAVVLGPAPAPPRWAVWLGLAVVAAALLVRHASRREWGWAVVWLVLLAYDLAQVAAAA